MLATSMNIKGGLLTVLRNDNGVPSMMRLCLLINLIVGTVLIACAIVLAFMATPAPYMVTAGALMMTGGGFAKALQKRYE